MNDVDTGAIAVNAAGIADSMRGIACEGIVSDDRLSILSEQFSGSIGIMLQVAEAGAVMERFRVRQGPGATWGGELPYIYDVWDAIASAMWLHMEEESLEDIVLKAIESTANSESMQETKINNQPNNDAWMIDRFRRRI